MGVFCRDTNRGMGPVISRKHFFLRTLSELKSVLKVEQAHGGIMNYIFCIQILCYEMQGNAVI